MYDILGVMQIFPFPLLLLYGNGLVQDCSISIANALEIL